MEENRKKVHCACVCGGERERERRGGAKGPTNEGEIATLSFVIFHRNGTEVGFLTELLFTVIWNTKVSSITDIH